MPRRRDPNAELRVQRALRRAEDEAQQPAMPRRPGARLPISTVTLPKQEAQAGMRTVNVTGVAGIMPRDMVMLFPTAALPAGFAIHNAVASAPGTLSVTMTVPAGAGAAIECRVLAMR